MNPIRVGIAGLGRSGWDIHARLLEPLAERYAGQLWLGAMHLLTLLLPLA